MHIERCITLAIHTFLLETLEPTHKQTHPDALTVSGQADRTISSG